MLLKHRVKIKVTDKDEPTQEVVRSGSISLPKRLLHLLIGDFKEAFVVIPGESVEGIEVEEIGGEKDDDD